MGKKIGFAKRVDIINSEMESNSFNADPVEDSIDSNETKKSHEAPIGEIPLNDASSGKEENVMEMIEKNDSIDKSGEEISTLSNNCKSKTINICPEIESTNKKVENSSDVNENQNGKGMEAKQQRGPIGKVSLEERNSIFDKHKDILYDYDGRTMMGKFSDHKQLLTTIARDNAVSIQNA